jgi:hypothetical protein
MLRWPGPQRSVPIPSSSARSTLLAWKSFSGGQRQVCVPCSFNCGEELMFHLIFGHAMYTGICLFPGTHESDSSVDSSRIHSCLCRQIIPRSASHSHPLRASSHTSSAYFILCDHPTLTRCFSEQLLASLVAFRRVCAEVHIGPHFRICHWSMMTRCAVRTTLSWSCFLVSKTVNRRTSGPSTPSRCATPEHDVNRY